MVEGMNVSNVLFSTPVLYHSDSAAMVAVEAIFASDDR